MVTSESFVKCMGSFSQVCHDMLCGHWRRHDTHIIFWAVIVTLSNATHNHGPSGCHSALESINPIIVIPSEQTVVAEETIEMIVNGKLDRSKRSTYVVTIFTN